MEDMEQIKSKNMKLFPIYKMFSADLLFFYAISFLFLTEVKGLSVSSVLYAEAFYTVFKIVFLIPCITIVDKLGKRKSLLIANTFLCVHTLIYIFANGIVSIVIANIFAAISFNIKNMCESNMLYDFATSEEDKERFTKIDSKGVSLHFYIEGLTSIGAGFLYVINPYLPIIISLLFGLFSIYLTYKFNDSKIKRARVRMGEYFKELKYAFRYIFKSNRLKSFILYLSILTGVVFLIASYRKALMQDLLIRAEYFGIIFAILNIICGISSNMQSVFHNKFRNKSLTYIAIPFTVSAALVAIIAILPIPNSYGIPIILVLFAIQFVSRGLTITLSRKYLTNFSTPNIRTRIFSAVDLAESITRTIIILLGGLLLDVVNIKFAFLIIGTLSTIIMILILKYMKTRIGLKPEEYKKEDIHFVELK